MNQNTDKPTKTASARPENVRTDKTDLDSINHESRLYVINCGHGFTCLGFDVCEARAEALAKELNVPHVQFEKGTSEHYYGYQGLVKVASERNDQTGWRSESELTPQLQGLEGYRVEVVTDYNEKRRFIVGRSTGWRPCNLEIANRRSLGGPSAEKHYKSVRTLYKAR